MTTKLLLVENVNFLNSNTCEIIKIPFPPPIDIAVPLQQPLTLILLKFGMGLALKEELVVFFPSALWTFLRFFASDLEAESGV